MSADHWAVCPRCLVRARADAMEKSRAAAEAYGKVPVEEWQAMNQAAIDAVPDPENFRTFREDYEFYGADEGAVTATYKGECQTCGLSVSFRHEHPFYSGEEEGDASQR